MSNLNTAVMHSLLSQVAAGTLKPHSLMQSVNANQIIRVGDQRFSFAKEGPGAFNVYAYSGSEATPAEITHADSANEAKLELIDQAVAVIRQQEATAAAEVLQVGQGQEQPASVKLQAA